jgi:uncharacterized PurR-regulated membrane protein YhhQ (DUF165 family)
MATFGAMLKLKPHHIVPVLGMVVVVAGSNVAVQYLINDWLTWGALTYPFAFLVTDLTNRRYGPDEARRVVYVGFGLAVLLSILLAGPRIGLASGGAFLSAQLLDIAVFNRLRRLPWWQAPLASSALASTWDTAVFFTLAFAGTGLPWVTWGLGDLAAKGVMVVVLLLPVRALMSPSDRWAQPAR